MYTTLEVVLIAAVALLIGGAATYLAGRLRSPAGRRNDEPLRRLEQEHQHYRQDVTEHFGKTAEMLGQLANSYREVHNHLARGAQSLCDPGAVRALRALPDDLGTESQPARHETLEPPRDYSVTPDSLTPDPLQDHSEQHRGHGRAIIEPPRY